MRTFAKHLRAMMALLLIAMACTTYAQEKVRYVWTKSVNSDGTVQEFRNPNALYFVFDGDLIHEYSPNSNRPSIHYKYHHQEDGNSVYYCWDLRPDDSSFTVENLINNRITKKWVYDEGALLIVSPDRMYINSKIRTLSFTSVYERRAVDTVGPMYK